MQTTRFFLPLHQLPNPPITYELGKDTAAYHHLARVLRAQAGWPVEILDADSPRKIAGKIMGITSESITFSLEKEIAPEPKANLTVLLALPEIAVLERVTEKLTEIGAAELVVFIGAHSQAKGAKERLESKLLRLQKIRDAACIQSGAPRLNLKFFESLEDVFEKVPPPPTARKFIASLQPDSTNLQRYLHKSFNLEPSPLPADIFLIIGPEGDLSPHEYQLASKREFIPISLGDTVLRVETAAICSAFTLLNYFS